MSFSPIFRVVLLVIASMGLAAPVVGENSSTDQADAGPWILGRGVDLFEVGDLVAKDDFRDLRQWVVQVQEARGDDSSRVEAKDGVLDCFVPGRGCTVWFKKKFSTRVVITYDVVCPTPDSPGPKMMARDINNFWMAADPDDPDKGLFDPAKYNGDFGTYNKMRGYYASTGGGKNTTTRMRRYPREVDGKPADHIALKSRDGVEEYLITPDRKLRVQLVAYDDVVQYIVDGKLVYEMAHGDEVQIEGLDENGKRVMRTVNRDAEESPFYREGFFGFRMVGTHHRYSNFRVHRLVPAKRKVEVSSIQELREVASESNQHVVMKPGHYVLEDLIEGRIGFEFSGSNNHFELKGVTIETPISVYHSGNSVSSDRSDRRGRRGRRGTGTIEVRGDHVTISGGTFENTYPEGKEAITDFGSYNQDRDHSPPRGATEIRLRGDDILLKDCQLTVRGSYPYGYGNIYGIGSEDTVVGLRKHCGVLITGDRVTIDGCKVKIEAFGHAIFVQGGDQIVVRNTEVEGAVRLSNELYEETDDGDLAKKFDYQIQWPKNVKGLAIPRDHMVNLVEDGIRAYNGTGHMTVENCKVSKTRGGIKLYMAKSATITDCEVRDTVIQGYSIPSRGKIRRCRGNAAYGPLLYVHMDSHHSQEIDLEVLPAPHALGDHPLAAIKGEGHHIRLTSKHPVPPEQQRPIIVGYPLRFDYLSKDFPAVPKGMEGHYERFAPDDYRARNITLFNGTDHPVVLGEQSERNRITSRGEVRDDGKDNFVRLKKDH